MTRYSRTIMMKSIISVIASAIGIAAYVVPPPVPLPPNCFPTHSLDVPGYSCYIYDPVVGGLVAGPFVPYQPYVESARYHQNQWNTFNQDYMNEMHSWQLGEFDRYRTFLENSPWPKPYGFDAFSDNQKEWLEYYQKMERANMNIANLNRQRFLNWHSGRGWKVDDGEH